MMLCINGEMCMVILLVNLLVKMHVVESHGSWCMDFGPIFVCSGPMVGIWNGELYVHIGGSDPSGDLERGEPDVHDWYHMHIALSCI